MFSVSVRVSAFVTVPSSRQECGAPGGVWCFRFGPGRDDGAGYEVQVEKRQR